MEVSTETPDLTVVEFVALLQQTDTESLATGLKRCRDAIARGGTVACEGEEGVRRGLASAYLQSSPNAQEIFTIWDGLGVSRNASTGRMAALVVDLVGVLLAFCESVEEEGTPLAWAILRTRSKGLAMALSTPAPRMLRCTLKLLTTIANFSGALATEVVRRVHLAPEVVASLAATRHDSAQGTSTGGGVVGGGAAGAAAAAASAAAGGSQEAAARPMLTLKAIKRAKSVGGAKAADPGAAARHIYQHGRYGDDVRSAFVRLVCALMSSGSEETVRAVVGGKLRACFPAVVRGLMQDPPGLVLTALGAFGDAFLLSGLLPPRACASAWGPGTLITMAKLYGRVQGNIVAAVVAPGGEEAVKEKACRTALHALLVGLTTGRLLSREEIEGAADLEAGVLSTTRLWRAGAMGGEGEEEEEEMEVAFNKGLPLAPLEDPPPSPSSPSPNASTSP